MVSMKDIANKLGISRCTVSDVLNGRMEDKSYRKETIDAVLRTADEMGYVSNTIAKSLKTGSTCTIAVVVPDIANSFYIRIIKEVERLANERGYSLIICMAEEILDRENRALTMLQSRCVDGVLISPVSYNGSLQNRYPFKLVCFDRTVADNRFPTVRINNYEGGRLLVRALKDDGASRPLVMAGSPEDYSVIERLRGCREELGELDPSQIVYGIYDDASACAALTRRLESETDDFDSLYLLTNYFIYGALQALKDKRVQLKSVGGFEMFNGRDYIAEKVHVVRQPEAELGRAAFDTLSRLLRGDDAKDTVLPIEVV